MDVHFAPGSSDSSGSSARDAALGSGGSSEFGDERWFERLRRAQQPPAGALGTLGSFELVEEISRGGQGVVYRAVQSRTKRPVAVKRLLNSRFATPAALARFEREVEAAAALNHPHVVTVYGLEIVDDQPLLAMEWIDGQPIDAWADGGGSATGGCASECAAGAARDAAAPRGAPAADGRSEAVRAAPGTARAAPGAARAAPGAARRPLRDVLRAMVAVCDAVQHAHQRGVIHRDLKPGNILVDRDGRPHVLDFGLAKLLRDDDSAAAATLTLSQDFLGTPAYASPEQVRGEHGAVDVRSDVHALGLILYRLTTGRLPFATENIARLLHDIQHTEPARPTVFNRALPRELELIVLKALRKDPAQRYQSVDALGADLRRHLAGEPVLAHPPSAAYQFRKFASRHRGVVISAAATAVVLLAGIAATSVAMLRAWDAERRADDEARTARQERQRASEQAKLAVEEAQRARLQAAIAETANRTIREVLTAADRGEQQGRTDVTVREVFDRLSEQLSSGTMFDASPFAAIDPAARSLVEADLRNTLGAVYRALGLYDQGLPHLRAALRIRSEQLGENDPATVQNLHNLALMLHDRGEYAEAEALARREVEATRSAAADDPAGYGSASLLLASIVTMAGRYDEAQEPMNAALDAFERAEGPDSLAVGEALQEAAMLAAKRGDPRTAEEYYRRSLPIIESRLGRHPRVASALTNLGQTLQLLGRLDQAESYFRRSVELQREMLGDDHPHVAICLNNLAMCLRVAGKLDEAEDGLRRSLKVMEARFGLGHPTVAAAINNLASLVFDRGRFQEADDLMRQATEGCIRALGEKHPDVAQCICNRGAMRNAMGDLDGARSLYQQALELRREVLGPEHAEIARNMHELGRVLMKQGELAAAEPLLRDAFAMRQRLLDARHPDIADSLSSLGTLLRRKGDLAGAEEMLSGALELQEHFTGQTHPDYAGLLANLGDVKTDQRAFGEAEALYRRAYEIIAAALPASHPNTVRCHIDWGGSLIPLGRFADAERVLLDAEQQAAATGPERKLLLSALVKLYDAWHAAEPDAGHDASAEKWRRAAR
ncbi:MAG: Serine/threonine-protein kinase PknD [Phycisphaerae bacterium]|nr:Serine/threonine-protein kinase PknD [Phycisphaerae bacterium]